MYEKPTHLKIRPKTYGQWLILPLSNIDAVKAELEQSEAGEEYEILLVKMTEEEYKNLPEHEGF